jgi:hypothetical protein
MALYSLFRKCLNSADVLDTAIRFDKGDTTRPDSFQHKCVNLNFSHSSIHNRSNEKRGHDLLWWQRSGQILLTTFWRLPRPVSAHPDFFPPSGGRHPHLLAADLLKALPPGLGKENGDEKTAEHEERKDLHNVTEPP